MLIDLLWFIIVPVPPWYMLYKCISQGPTSTNAFPKTSQILPIGRIGVGIRTDPRSLEVIIKFAMKLWGNDLSYWIQYKINCYGMPWWYTNVDSEATACITYWQWFFWCKLWWRLIDWVKYGLEVMHVWFHCWRWEKLDQWLVCLLW